MGGIIGGSSPKPPPPPKPTPMADEEAIAKAKQRARASLQQRSGRASTVLSDSEKLGG